MRWALNDGAASGRAIMHLAGSWTAGWPLVAHDPALVLAGRAMVDRRLTVAAPVAAAAQVGVEVLKHLHVELADRQVPRTPGRDATARSARSSRGCCPRFRVPAALLHGHAERGLGPGVHFVAQLHEQAPTDVPGALLGRGRPGED